MKKRLPFVILIFVAVVMALAVRSRIRERVERFHVSGTIECEEVSIGSREGGRVTRVFVKEGDAVRAGDLLVRLDSRAVEAALDQARAAERGARSRLALLRAGLTPEEIEAARDSVAALKSQSELVQRGARDEQIAAAEADYRAADIQYQNQKAVTARVESLFKSGFVSKQDFDGARATLDASARRVDAARALFDMARNGPLPEEKAVAEARLAQGKANLRHAEKGSRPEAIEDAAAMLEQASANVRALEVRLDETSVKAPSNAVVDIFDLHPGDLLAPNEEAARLILGDSLWVRVFVPEGLFSCVSLNMPVDIVVDAFPKETFKGKITVISHQAEFTPRNVQTPEGRATQVYRVKVVLSDPTHRLRAGMTALARIPCGEDR